MSLGPRACTLCGPEIEGCWKCGAKFGHRHLSVVNRHGLAVAQVAACAAHGPPVAPDDAQAPWTPPAPSGRLSSAAAESKRARDRERRRAQRVVLDRHADEVAAVLAEIRGDA